MKSNFHFEDDEIKNHMEEAVQLPMKKAASVHMEDAVPVQMDEAVPFHVVEAVPVHINLEKSRSQRPSMNTPAEGNDRNDDTIGRCCYPIM